MSITTRDNLIGYSLRKLGDPIVKINVTDDQIDDCVVDAFEKYWYYHPDGLQETYLKHLVTAADVTNRFIHVPEYVFGIKRVVPYNSAQGSSKNFLFDVQYQMRMSDIWDMTSSSIGYYTQAMTHLRQFELILNGQPLFRFNRFTDKMELDINWGVDLKEGDYLIVECYRAIDPAAFPRVYSDPWLKDYLTSKIKAQWGTNLKKYQGVQLIGGVTVDGNSLYDEATQEMKDLEGDIITNGAPLEFFVG